MTVKPLVAAVFAFGLGLALGSCSSFSDYVSDHWPHFAGGEPDGVPPRSGSPGYAAFIAHGQPTETANSQGNGQAGAPGATSSVAEQKSAGATQQSPGTNVAPVGQAPRNAAQTPMTVAAPPGAADHDIAQGGLY
jgi:hypothetical protein